jgi:type I restriction enzyme, S subunit
MKSPTTLGEVCEHIAYGVTAAAAYTATGPRLLRITDITEDGVDWKKVPGCKISAQDHQSSKLIGGDIVVARTGGTVGKSFLIVSPPDAVCASYLLRLRPNQALILPEYLNLFLQSNSYWTQLFAAAQGAAQPNVNGTTLSKIMLSLPTLVAQRRWVQNLTGKLETVRQAHRAVATQLRELSNFAISLILNSLKFSRRESLLLGNVLEEVKDGIGNAWIQYPVLGATRAGLAPARERPGKNPERYKPAFPGTVFYNPMRILIGSIAFVDDDDRPGITSPDYVALKGKPGLADSRWFYYWLRSPLGEKCINSLARGAVRERMLFNRLAEGEIELPDFIAQEQASQALAKIKPMQGSIEKQKQDLELMPQKLLVRVFES